MRSSRVRAAVAILLVAGAAAVVLATREDGDGDADPFACRDEVLARPPALEDPPPAPELVLAAVVEDQSISAIAPFRDGLVYAGSREGEILLVDVAARTSRSVLDLRPLGVEREAGLQGLAVDPDRTHLYVTHTSGSGVDNVLVEYPIDAAGVVDDGQARVVLELDSPHQHHNMAHITFGPDGLLYVGVGDGGAPDGDRRADPASVAQDLTSLRGKILRIDPRPDGGAPYSVPGDNPFVATEGARPEIFVVGFRNPWRFSFDQVSGDLWIGDAGQFCAEEHTRLAEGSIAGANLGWSGFEGFRAQRDDQQREGTVAPLHAYTRGEGPDGLVRCAAIGGGVYRGPSIPTLEGRYVFGDYCSGALEVVDVVDGAVATQVVAQLEDGVFVQTLGSTDGGEILAGTSAGLFLVTPAP